MYAAIVRSEPQDVDARLREMALERRSLLDAVRAAAVASFGCTAFDPRGAPGYESYRMGVRTLRERLVPLGWEANSDGGLESVIHRAKRLRLAFLNADSGAGRPDGIPQNRCKKGARSEGVSQANENFALFPEGELYLPVASHDAAVLEEDGYLTWHLCVYISSPNLVRAELAMLSGFDGGFFTSFIEKLILLGNGDWVAPVLKDEPDEPLAPPEINVRRK